MTPTPTLNDTTTLFPSQSFFPSQSPSEFPFIFEGIDDATSVYRGTIEIDWDFPTYDDGDVVDLDTVRYHLFASVGSYDFASALKNITVEELIAEFEGLSGDGMVQYHAVDSYQLYFSLNTTYDGELHTLLVIAEADGVFSRNVESTVVYASSSDPVLKEDVSIVGVFFPTENLNVTLSSNNSVLEFDGPVRQEHLSLTAGEYIIGYTTEFVLFTLLIINVEESSAQRVVLATEMARVEDLFQSLDYESSSAMSRPNKVAISSSSRQRYRHLISKKHSRRLWWPDVLNPVKWAEKAYEHVIKPIGDALVELPGKIVDAFEDLVNVLTKGEMEKTLELVDFDYDYNIILTPGGLKCGLSEDSEGNIGFEFGKAKIHVKARSDLYIRMRVSTNNPNLLVEGGWIAEYSADLELELFNELSGTYTKTLGKYPKKMHTIYATFVPVIVSVQPQVDFESWFGLKAKKGDDTRGLLKMKAGGNGSLRIIAGAELPPRLYADYKEPNFDPHFSIDFMDSAEFSLAVSVIPKVVVEVYEGALKGDLGIKVTRSLSMTVGPNVKSKEDSCSLSDAIDASFEISSFVELNSALSESLKYQKELFKLPLATTNFNIGGKKCPNPGSCSDDFLDGLVDDFADIFNSQVFLAQAPDPNDPPSPSKVYKFEDFIKVRLFHVFILLSQQSKLNRHLQCFNTI
jgi:hypothetical protein